MSVVNLNKARKAKARAVKSARADENAIKFGRTKAVKDTQKALNLKAKTHLDGHKNT